jgi:hypothetical protein
MDVAMANADDEGFQVLDVRAIETDLATSLGTALGAVREAGQRVHTRISGGKTRSRTPLHTIKVRVKLADGGEVDIHSAIRKAMVEAFGASNRCIAIDHADPLVEQTLIDVIERVPEVLHARRERMSQDNIDRLVDTFLKVEPTASARAEIELDNARERARFREEVDCFTSRQVAELAGHAASNASATATRWKSARRIVGLPWKDGDLYPAFQFQDGQPRPVIGRALAALPAAMTPWQIAFWFTSSNSWLDGATPEERLDDADAVVTAAKRENEKLIG